MLNITLKEEMWSKTTQSKVSLLLSKHIINVFDCINETNSEKKQLELKV